MALALALEEKRPAEYLDEPEGGEEGAQRGQEQDGPLLLQQLAQVDVQRAREQQEAQEPLHEQRVEVDLGQEPGREAVSGEPQLV